MDDARLLHAYVRDRDETAFAELVRRHVDLVYTAALRRTGGDAGRAADVTQQVFIDLAKKAGTLLRHPALPAWLHRSTCFAAANLRRQERRRHAREESAANDPALAPDPKCEPAADWAQIAPVLDAELDSLGEADREAIVLRYFARQPFAEIAARLKTTEAAAQMRTARALGKLRRALQKRGVTSTASALELVLGVHAVSAAPAWIAPAALTAASAAGATAALPLFTMSLLKHAATGLVCATLAGLAVHRFTPFSPARPVPPSVSPPRAAENFRAAEPALPPPEAPKPDPRLAALSAENARLRARLAAAEAERASTSNQLAELRRPLEIDMASSTLRASLASGEGIVTGGYKLPDGSRLFSFVQTEFGAGQGVVLVNRMVAMPDEVARRHGLDTLVTNSANSLQHGEVWAGSEMNKTLSELSKSEDVMKLSAPTITTLSGQKVSLAMGGHNGQQMNFLMTPTLTTDKSRIDLELRMESLPGESTPTSPVTVSP